MLPRLFVMLSYLLLLTRVAIAVDPIHSAMDTIFATDPRFHFEGRFDQADPAQPVVIWSGSRISIDFEGSELAFVFGASTGQCVFDISVDGTTDLANLTAGRNARFFWKYRLGEGRHHLVIFKRSEASKGHAVFRGVQIAVGAQAWTPPAPAYRLKIEFLGDSITAGACNEDGGEDQWTNFLTHNHALSYDFLTSQALSADHRAMAVSGMGIATGWEPMLAGEVWDKLYPRGDSPRADLKTWQPDVAFINFGENDDSFTLAHNLPFPSGYVPGYLALVKAVRAAYPHAQIVLLRGGMQGGAKSGNLRTAWESVVHEVEAADPRITHYVFTHWSKLHPRVSDDRAMAGELTAWLKQQSFMAPFL